MNRYPILIPSKGRWQEDRALTAKTLARDGVRFRLVVEPQEADAYRRLLAKLGRDPEDVLVLPFRDAGSSTPARRWLHDRAKAEGFARYWCVDDNIIEFRRIMRGRRIPCDAALAFRICEDLSDRFSNVAVSGMNYQMFVPAETPVPYYVNVHVYSTVLVNLAAPVRWRLRYNEDTDLCLQALTAKATPRWCTLALNAFMANKLRTMALGGGNSDALYGGAGATDTEGRWEMAETLRAQWEDVPGIVKVTRRFDRWQHTVNWGRFQQPLRFRDGLDITELPPEDEHGIILSALGEVKSPALRRLLEEAA